MIRNAKVMISSLVTLVFMFLATIGIFKTYEKLEEVVLVKYLGPKVDGVYYNGSRVATAFQYKRNGERYTVTNLHVCQIRLNTINLFGTEFPEPNSALVGRYLRIGNYNQRILAVDTVHDLCLLTPDKKKGGLSGAFFRPSEGEEVRLIGYPRGLPRTYREGRVMGSIFEHMPWLQYANESFLVSTISYGGNSGSPVLNKYGQVIGVLYAGSRVYHTEALIVPLRYLNDFIDRYEAE